MEQYPDYMKTIFIIRITEIIADNFCYNSVLIEKYKQSWN